MRGMIKTIATNRLACIILPDGLVSENFPLEQGNAQGDAPSPLLFNIANQILLLKLELDPRIRGAGKIIWTQIRNIPVPVPENIEQAAAGVVPVPVPVPNGIRPLPLQAPVPENIECAAAGPVPVPVPVPGVTD